MKLFVDSGIVKEIEALAALGIIDGATTNPSLMAKAGGDPRQILKEICRIVQGPVSGEVVATDYDGMIREGHDIAARVKDRILRERADDTAGVMVHVNPHRGEGRP